MKPWQRDMPAARTPPQEEGFREASKQFAISASVVLSTQIRDVLFSLNRVTLRRLCNHFYLQGSKITDAKIIKVA